MQKIDQEQYGISIIELLLVLAIAAVITFLGINHYRQQRLQTEITAVQDNVKLIFNALDYYYFANCNINLNNNNLQVTMPDLINANLLQKPKHSQLLQQQIDGTDYEVFITYTGLNTATTGKPIYRFRIIANLNFALSGNAYYKNILGANASPALGTELVWEKMPSYVAQSVGSDFWILNSGLGVYKEAMLGPNNQQDISCGY